MQIADTLLNLYQFARALALLCAGWFIVSVAMACLWQFHGSGNRWESFRVRLHANAVLLSLLLMVLSQTGIWFSSDYNAVSENRAEFQAIFALLLLLGIQAPDISKLLVRFEESIIKGVDFLPSATISITRKLQLSVTVSCWLVIFLLIGTNFLDNNTLLRTGVQFILCVVGVWSLLMVVNDQWVNFYLNKTVTKPRMME